MALFQKSRHRTHLLLEVRLRPGLGRRLPWLLWARLRLWPGLLRCGLPGLLRCGLPGLLRCRMPGLLRSGLSGLLSRLVSVLVVLRSRLRGGPPRLLGLGPRLLLRPPRLLRSWLRLGSRLRRRSPWLLGTWAKKVFQFECMHCSDGENPLILIFLGENHEMLSPCFSLQTALGKGSIME